MFKQFSFFRMLKSYTLLLISLGIFTGCYIDTKLSDNDPSIEGIAFADSKGQSSLKKTFFIDSVGHSALFLSNDMKHYGYAIVEGNITLDKKVANCSNERKLCFKEPFLFTIQYDRIKSDLKQITGSDNEKSCTYQIAYSNDNEIGIKSYICNYYNGMPSPQYMAAKIEGHNYIVQVFL